jgi:hypothetical protein
MVFSLVAYFVSMVTAFAVVMTVLVDFGDSQLRIGRISQPAVSVLAGSDRDALTNSEKAREAQKAAEARKVLEAQRAAAEKAAEAKENAKKLARAKLARERKEATIARQRQEAFGYAGQFPNGTAGLYSYAPRW